MLEGEQELKTNQEQLTQIMTDLERLKPGQAIKPSQGKVTDSDIKAVAKFEREEEELKSKIASAEKTIAEAQKALLFRGCEQ
jgi:hypothetical protein